MSMLEMEYLIYSSIGIFSGFFAGLLGIGSGVIVSPVLIIIFLSLWSFDTTIATSLAIGTAITCAVITSFVSAITHAKYGNVSLSLGLPIAAGAMFGAFFAVPIALKIPPETLQLILVSFMLYNIITLNFSNKHQAITPSKMLSPPILLAFSTITGGVSAAIGIGGGIIIVPFLSRFGVPIKKAIGTSSFVGLFLASSASVAYVYNGWDVDLPSNSFGFVYIPALIGIGLVSIISARVGAMVTEKVPAVLVRRIFSVLLLIIAVRMLTAIM